eukprot:TRINITY_DN80420_c0_g1_i1.p1 TRINITY_DN80420_c0_g1~~TRINITY_DN80420_c0_g1_i1.p1  ORF type:complete len:266 (+),score=65.09 TRINITY_DN80420_c0_g1_i1:46-798(+)
MQPPARPLQLGILALQGAFEEHEAMFNALPRTLVDRLKIFQVRKSEELDKCDALVIPGGESTTMKIVAGTDEFMTVLKSYVHGGPGADGVERKPRPVWGTCAGCILLSDEAVNSAPQGDRSQPAKRCKYGDPVGGLDVETCRNYFGRQAQSFEAAVDAVVAEGAGEGAEAGKRAFDAFPAVFIRAPAILRTGAGVRPLAKVKHPCQGADSDGVLVAAESDRILVTTFHPELVQDSRIHRYFVERFVLGLV